MILRNIKLIRISMVLAMLWGGHLAAQNEVVIDKIIGKVDNYIVLKSDLEKAYLDFLSRGEPAGDRAKCKVLETLIINKVLVAKAEIDSVIVEEAEVQNNLDRRLQYFISQIGSEEKIEEYYGKTLDQFKQELSESIREQLTAQKMEQTITSELAVTPGEVKRFFKNIPQDSLPYFSTEVTVAQLVKIPEVSKEEEQKVKDQLNELRERILSGEDFRTLASKYSMDPSAQQNSGELGFFPRGQLAPEYEATSLSMRPGQISEPVKTDFGWHIIQLVERRGNLFNTRHILIIPQPLESDFKRTEVWLDSVRTVVMQDSAIFENIAKEHSDDQLTSSSGGFFQSPDGATRVSVEELDPVIFFAIDTMKIGTVSPPMRFRMDDGTQALRILFYKDKLRPHQANLNDDYQKIYVAALNEKKTRTLNEWFLKARNEVFIDLDPEYNSCNILNPNN